MKVLSAQRPDAIEQAMRVIEAGGTVAFPTDTVYGLGVRVDDAAAIEKLYTIKEREKNKAIAVLLADRSHLAQITLSPNAITLKLADAFWPGPLTLVVPRRPDLPENLSPWDTVGVRIPDHPVALALLQATGPLAVTSANLSGQASTRTAEAVITELGERVDLILDGGETPGREASTVARVTGNDLTVFRVGPIDEVALRNVLSSDFIE